METIDKRLEFIKGLQKEIDNHIGYIRQMNGNFPDLENWYHYKINRYSQLIARYSK